MDQALGILETTALTPALVALDVMGKSARIEVRQAELNDFLGVVIKISGGAADVAAAIAAGVEAAERMQGAPVSQVIPRVDPDAWQAIWSPAEFNPLIQQDVVFLPTAVATTSASSKESIVAEVPSALGLIETQGFTAVFAAIDTACKAAGVEVVGKEKLGGGYVTVIIQGDVAAVKAAVEAGQAAVEGLGKLVAAHVIARPSPAVLGLLPKA